MPLQPQRPFIFAAAPFYEDELIMFGLHRNRDRFIKRIATLGMDYSAPEPHQIWQQQTWHYYTSLVTDDETLIEVLHARAWNRYQKFDTSHVKEMLDSAEHRLTLLMDDVEHEWKLFPRKQQNFLAGVEFDLEQSALRKRQIDDIWEMEPELWDVLILAREKANPQVPWNIIATTLNRFYDLQLSVEDVQRLHSYIKHEGTKWDAWKYVDPKTDPSCIAILHDFEEEINAIDGQVWENQEDYPS